MLNYDGTPKPAYTYLQQLTTALSGYQFVRQLPSTLGDYILQFSNGTQSKIAAWTTQSPHPATIQLANFTTTVSLTGSPVYIPVLP